MWREIFILIFMGCICLLMVHSKLELTNIKCESLDKSQIDLDICILKSINRTYKYLTIHVKFPAAQPLNDIKVNVATLRKGNGYKPFLYNMTIDACNYFKHRKTYPVVKFAHSLFEKYSSLNRTCPYGQLTVHSKLELTNMKCETLDKSQIDFGICILKSVNRTYKYLTVHIKRPTTQPLNDIKVNFAILRKANGYKPFLYNLTFDACNYFKHRKNYPVANFAHKFFEKYSSLNRTCPYGQHDEWVEKLPASYIDNVITDALPVPHGDYLAKTEFYFYKKLVAKIRVYVTLS